MILVVGGCGFIGSHVVKSLIEQGQEVVAFDIVIPSPLPQPLRDVADDVKFVKGDLTNLAELLDVFVNYKIDHIVHLAWLMDGSRRSALTALKINVEGTCKVLEAARLMKVKRVVFASSEDVYGSAALHPEPAKEEDPIWPGARHITYASNKAMAEYLGKHYHSVYGLNFIALRFGTIYGFGCRGWFANFFQKPLRGEPFQTREGWGRDANRYNFLYVKDVGKAIQLAIKIKDPGFRIFNISGGIYSIKELVETVKRLIPGAVIHTKAGEALHLTPSLINTTRANKELGFEPSYTLEEGSKEYLDHLKLYASKKVEKT